MREVRRREGRGKREEGKRGRMKIGCNERDELCRVKRERGDEREEGKKGRMKIGCNDKRELCRVNLKRR